MADICSFLDEHGIPFERFDHPAVFTCEQAAELKVDIPGGSTKNLFLRDRKGKRHILVITGHEKKVDLKALAEVINVDKLSFASSQRLKKFLGVDPGAVTLLGLINDEDCCVEVVFDEDVWKEEQLQCHPLVNTATLVISHVDIERFLKATGHEARIIAVPGRK